MKKNHYFGLWTKASPSTCLTAVHLAEDFLFCLMQPVGSNCPGLLWPFRIGPGFDADPPLQEIPSFRGFWFTSLIMAFQPGPLCNLQERSVCSQVSLITWLARLKTFSRSPLLLVGSRQRIGLSCVVARLAACSCEGTWCAMQWHCKALQVWIVGVLHNRCP